MRFGDVRNIAFDLDPLSPSWERRAPSERGPWARLSIWVANRNLCSNWLPTKNEVHEGIFVPIAPIADWLVRCAPYIAYEESARSFPTDINLPQALEEWKSAVPAAGYAEDSWDDLRFAWSERHFLLAGSDGSWLPNLSCVKVDEVLWISIAPARFATEGSPLFFFSTGVYQIPWAEAKLALSQFVDYVGIYLRESSLTSLYPWSEEPGAFERSLAIDLLGYASLELELPPGEVADLFGVSSEEELRRRLDLPTGASPADSVALLALRDLELESGIIDLAIECDFSTRSPGRGLFRERRLRVIDAAPGHTPEEQGAEAARLMRRDLGLDGGPLSNLEDLLDRDFEIKVDERCSSDRPKNNTIAGAHRDGSGKVILFRSPQTEKKWSRRMELARSAGHLLLDASPSSPAVGAASSGRAVGPRRRRSGAFAAEFLLPQSEIRKRSGGVLDAAAQPEVFRELMSEYGVGARTAAWQCFNAGLLSSQEVVERLIDTYGA